MSSEVRCSPRAVLAVTHHCCTHPPRTHPIQVEQELSILRQLRHENVVGFLFVADQGSRISIVMDWAGESLRDQRSRAGAYFCEATARHMVYQLTHALAYLHAKVSPASSATCSAAS